jgi:hypothetical protein
MEALVSSEMLVLTRATWRNMPENNILHGHRCENLKSYKLLLDVNIFHGEKKIADTHNTKFLGLILDSAFSWEVHIDSVVPKLSSVCYAVRMVKPLLSQVTIKMVYCSYFHSIMTSGIIFWGNSSPSNSIFRLQMKAT